MAPEPRPWVPTALTHGWMWRRRAFEAAFALVAFAPALPLLLPSLLPIQDLPQHLATLRVLHEFGAYAHRYELALGSTQYLLFYGVCHLVAYAVGVEWAARLVTAAGVLALPYAIRALLRAAGRDERVAFLAAPLALSPSVLVGYLNFATALPLVFWAFALLIRERTPRREAALALLGLCVWFDHVLAFAFLALGAACLALPDWRRLRWFAPSAIAALVWILRTPATVSTASSRPVWDPFPTVLASFPEQLLGFFHDPLGDRVLAGLAVAALLMVIPGGARVDRPRQPRLALLAALAAALYLALPVGYGWVWGIYHRYAQLAALCALLLLKPRQSRLSWLGVAVAASCSLALGAGAARRFSAFAGEAAGFEEVLGRAQPGRKLVALIYDRGSRFVQNSPFLHFGAYYQARGGEVATFSFTDFPQSPIRYREEGRPPRLPPRWEWTPEEFDPEAHAAYYDYVLTRGSGDPWARRPELRWPVLARSGAWTLYGSATAR